MGVKTTTQPGATEQRKLPLPALLALATAVFITSLTETLPAGGTACDER
jgi:hypothetical protein